MRDAASSLSMVTNAFDNAFVRRKSCPWASEGVEILKETRPFPPETA